MAILAQLVPQLPNVLIVAPWAQLTGQLAREIQTDFWTKAGVAPVTKPVWIVLGQGLSLQAFSAERQKDRPRGQVIQLIYLLQSTWNSVSSAGAKLRVFVRP